MTTMPMTRPSAPPGARSGPSPFQGPAAGVVAVDPIKLGRKYKWFLGAALAGGVALGVGGHYLLMAVFPVYTAEVVWECYPQDKSIGDLGSDSTTTEELDKFMGTQAQIMMANAVIDGAVTDPAMERNAPQWYARFVKGGQFNQVAASKSLDRRLRASIVGDTQLIRLSYWSTDREDAAAVVNIIADAYERNRSAAVNRIQAKRRDLLSRVIADIKANVDSLQKDRVRLIETNKVESLDEQINQVQAQISELSERLVAVRTTLEAYGSQLTEMRAQLESKSGIVYDDDIRAAVEQDPVLQRLHTTRNELDAELVSMRLRGIGPQHMDYKAVDSRRQGIEQSYQEEREKMLRREFDSQLETMAKTVSAGRAQEADLISKLEDEQRRGTELSKARAEIEDIKKEIANLNEAKTKQADKLYDLTALGKLDTAARILKLQNAETPRDVTFPKLYIMIPAGIVLVMGLAVGVILLIEVVDQRVKGPMDIQMISRTRMLGMIPHAAEDPSAPARVETVFRDQPNGVLAESFRQLRAGLYTQLARKEHKSLLIVSGMPGSGASTAVINLAYALAASEHRVLIIDANFRRPTITKTLGLQDAPGVADIIANGHTLATAVQATDNAGVSVLAAGSPQHRKVERLATPGMTSLLRQAEKSYDVVLIDAAPAVVSGDALALANRCDATVLVVKAMQEKRGLVARLRGELGECKADFLGVIINGVRSSAGGYLRGNIRAANEYRTANE